MGNVPRKTIFNVTRKTIISHPNELLNPTADVLFKSMALIQQVGMVSLALGDPTFITVIEMAARFFLGCVLTVTQGTDVGIFIARMTRKETTKITEGVKKLREAKLYTAADILETLLMKIEGLLKKNASFAVGRKSEVEKIVADAANCQILALEAFNTVDKLEKKIKAMQIYCCATVMTANFNGREPSFVQSEVGTALNRLSLQDKFQRDISRHLNEGNIGYIGKKLDSRTKRANRLKAALYIFIQAEAYSAFHGLQPIMTKFIEKPFSIKALVDTGIFGATTPEELQLEFSEKEMIVLSAFTNAQIEAPKNPMDGGPGGAHRYEDCSADGDAIIGKIHYLGGAEYTGRISKWMPLGKGTMRYPNGSIFEGLWDKGQPLHHAKILFANCLESADEDSGEIFYNNGAVYKGRIAKGVPFGKGTMEYTDGTSFEGLWDNGKPLPNISKLFIGCWAGADNTSGKILYLDGAEYTGMISHGLPSGKGTMKYPDGTVFDGHWENGKIKKHLKLW
mmetsp:Transcript_2867/g.3722  ORF Transcript_2867/g.3722 Transcript_2867/m.3722 type:complete len:509 (+) Transcript_2867:264-1790(+)|eukprot:CAMPEP_0117736080 /NCGR_PEP_ID=MMETSP0947-20121206/1710_1 /TAXON_ID=44440 /ORGANISM="Chattonella subsalsa, Strain CCMP2191" /LENGTH=508 /DNA_ID=CAMNT_0005551289 /DNA_START=197 /DNA_END=1723 /DNA_ORIENTATION=-